MASPYSDRTLQGILLPTVCINPSVSRSAQTPQKFLTSQQASLLSFLPSGGSEILVGQGPTPGLGHTGRRDLCRPSAACASRPFCAFPIN